MAQANTHGFEAIARGLYLEGLAVDLERGTVWYSDVIAGGIHGLHPDGRTQSFNDDRMWTGGIMLNADGCVISSGGGGLMWNDPQTGRSGWLLEEIDDAPINGINEMVPDGTGGIYFGTVDIEKVAAGEPARPTAIYRLTTERQVIQVADGMNFTNGIMLSPDRKRLYCNDTFVGTYVFDVRPDMTLSEKKMFVDKVDVDGMALDAEGNLWITGFRSSELVRVRPDGSMLAPAPTPAGAITQIRFGGRDMQDIYINAVPGDAGDSLATGEMPTEKRSVLYRGRSDIPGMAIATARFNLGK
jgi:sugar lactone lactonase YvrE